MAGRPTTYDVKLWKTETYKGTKVTTHAVRWSVAGKARRRSFRTAAMAESFRADLVVALRKGEAFEIEAGLPLSMIRRDRPVITWYEFACSYVDMKWPNASPKHRKSIAESLVTATMSLLVDAPANGEAKRIRSALLNWGLNTMTRSSSDQPKEVTDALQWIASRSRPLGDLNDVEVLRQVLDALTLKVTGERAAPRTGALKRAILSGALDYAVERELLEANRILNIKTPGPKNMIGSVDRRAVINPDQALRLLKAVARTPRTGQHLVAFFGSMYYAGLRPEEAVALRVHNLELPNSLMDFGWLNLEAAAPEHGAQWSNSGDRREFRQLKHRNLGEGRRSPCPPSLVRLLRAHLIEFGVDEEGHLFRGEKGGPLPSATYTKLWGRARSTTFSREQLSSPLARRPYDLRHAAVSTWLNSGVPATQVAEWAGHSVAVLLRVYAKCIDGQEQQSLALIQQGLKRPSGGVTHGTREHRSGT